MSANATTFGAQAAAYAAARPTYPDDLFRWIAERSPATDAVLDVGTGNGQAAKALARRFARVVATDVDPAQIASAFSVANVEYRMVPADASGLPDASVDAVTVATALHWFDLPRFWDEVAHVCRPGGLFVGWTYARTEADPDLTERLLEPVLALIDPYWSDGNRLSWRGYPAEEVGFPFEQVAAPDLACTLDWSAADFAAFTRSWSAHARARQDGLANLLAEIETTALATLGPEQRSIRLPLSILAGRVGD